MEAAARAAEVEECLGREEGSEAAADGGERREGGAGHAGEDLEQELVGERCDGGLRLGVGILGVGGRDGDGDRDGGVAGGVGGDAGPREPREAARVAALPLRGHGWLPDRGERTSWLRLSQCICIPSGAQGRPSQAAVAARCRIGLLGEASGHGASVRSRGVGLLCFACGFVWIWLVHSGLV